LPCCDPLIANPANRRATLDQPLAATDTAKPCRNRRNHAKILVSLEAMGDNRAANGSIVWYVGGPEDRLRFSATDFPVGRM
jgi:hypothetical protein